MGKIINRDPPDWQTEKLKLARAIVDRLDKVVKELKILNEKIERPEESS